MNFIFYSHLPWEVNYCRELFYALGKCIEKTENIICIDRCCNILPDIILRPHKVFKWIRDHKAERVDENIILYQPLILIHDQIAKFIKFLTFINRLLIKKQIGKYIKGKGKIISYIADPLLYDYLKIFKGEISVYDCLAEWSSNPGMSSINRVTVKKFENKTLLKSDIVLTVSKELCSRRSKVNKNTHYLPWAAEYMLFGKDSAEIPNEMISMKKPIIGFAGHIWGIFDLDIIAKLSETFKNSSIVIVGSLRSLLPKGYKREFLNVTKRTNIRWLGPRKHGDLPKYLKCFDVCIMPYKIDDWTITCSPGKLYQYLAVGKPIVSTDLPEVSRYYDDDIVKIARSSEEFMEKVKLVLSETSDKNKIEKRKAIAKRNSWNNRAKAMIDIINECAQAHGGFDDHEQRKSPTKA